MTKARIVEVRHGILKKNDELARGLRSRFEAADTFVVNLVSSPGAGKTLLLEQTMQVLHPETRVAALVGDLATENDATRLARSGAAVRQISTGTTCHLEAEMIDDALQGWDLEEIDILFIETPLEQPPDVGQTQRVALFSATGGDDKPAEFPQRVAGADLIVLSKIDLLPLVQFDVARFRAETVRLNPRADLIELSLRNEFGMNTWIDWLLARQHALQSEPASDPSMPEWWFG